MEDSVKKIRLGEPTPPPAGGNAAGRPALPGWLIPLLPLVLLGSTMAGVWIVLRGPVRLFGGLVIAAMVLGFGWVLISSMMPAAPADRRCPQCHAADGLGPAHADTTSGVRCRACGFTDETASAWMIAEEDGPLQQVVLRERESRRTGLPPQPIEDEGR